MGRGTSLEIIVMASQTDVVLTQIENAAKMLPKRGAFGRKEWFPKLVKGPVDFVGTVVATGAAIFIDAKMDQTVSRFRCDTDHVRESQVVELMRHGRIGAHAGLLIEATGRGQYFWLNWHHLPSRGPSIAWDDPRLIMLGYNDTIIRWPRVLAARETVPVRMLYGGAAAVAH